MEKKVDLLIEMMEGLATDVQELKVNQKEMQKELKHQSDAIDKLGDNQDVFYKYLLNVYEGSTSITNRKISPIVEDVSFVVDKLHQLEKDIYRLKNA